MCTGREGHGVPAEPLNSLKYNQPLSLLGQLPGRAETLASPQMGLCNQARSCGAPTGYKWAAGKQHGEGPQ